MKRGKARKLPGVRANVGLQAIYRQKLEALVARMDADITAQLEKTWRAKPPEMSADASPAALLQAAMRKLATRWNRNFANLAPDLGRYFAKAAQQRTDAQLRAIFKKAGWTVDFTMTREIGDVLAATVAENVSLIKSIASQHLTQVEGAVMRSVAAGRDLGSLSRELRETYGVTKRRAAFIALDQSNKATADIHRARLIELDIEEAIWVHSHAGKKKRPTHVANSGKRFNVRKGWKDPATGKFIWPGTEIGCRCFSRPLIEGF